jgi:hypothetical protein
MMMDVVRRRAWARCCGRGRGRRRRDSRLNGRARFDGCTGFRRWCRGHTWFRRDNYGGLWRGGCGGCWRWLISRAKSVIGESENRAGDENKLDHVARAVK